MDPLDLELRVAEGRAMEAAFRQERGLDDTEDHGLADAIESLLHAAHAGGTDATDIAIEVMDSIAGFWTAVGRAPEPPVNERLSCNLRGRLNAIEHAAVAGDDARARRELLALLEFFPASRP